MSNIFSNSSNIPGTSLVDVTDRQARSLGSVFISKRAIRSYTAVFRLAEAAAQLDQTFTQVANTNKHWATLHHVAASVKTVGLMRCTVFIQTWATASKAILELRQINTAPATGNPAITPTPHIRGDIAAESICLYLPTTQGTDAGVNTPISHVLLNLGIVAGDPVLNPPEANRGIVLYDAQEAQELTQPELSAGTLDGWAVMLRAVTGTAVRLTVVMKFTEK